MAIEFDEIKSITIISIQTFVCFISFVNATEGW